MPEDIGEEIIFKLRELISEIQKLKNDNEKKLPTSLVSGN